MAHITLPNDDVSGNLRDGTDYAKGSYVYANDKALRDGINGGLDNTNLKAGAGIAASKIADTAVTLTATQTMSGKTLTSPAINGGTIESSPIGVTTPAAGSFTSLTATSSFIPSLVPGQVQNLSWTRGTGTTLGTITIASADGTDLSADNPAWVCIGSTAKFGGFVTLKVTANVTFIDDGGVSDLAGWTFGVTTGVAWNEWMPVTIYALNKDDTDAGLVFGFSRKPNAYTFSTGDIGDKDAVSSADDQNSIFIAGSITASDYNGAPVTQVGATIIKKVSTADDWTFAGSSIAYGFGEHLLNYVYSITYTFPVGQNGATAGSYYSRVFGTTTLNFVSSAYIYRINRNGTCTLLLTTGARSAADATEQGLKIHTPFASTAGVDTAAIGKAHVTVEAVSAIYGFYVNPSKFGQIVIGSGAALQVAQFHSASDMLISVSITYPAF